jgi:hypothetical protein
MGNFFSSYQPTGQWTKIRFIKKYSHQGNINSVEKMIETMDKTAKWLKDEVNTEGKYNTNSKRVELDNKFLKKIKDVVGNKPDWLQSSDKYLQIQKDFRKVYKIKTLIW